MPKKKDKEPTRKVNLFLPVELEKRFREVIFKKYGLRRGDISKAIKEAIEDWIKKNS